MAYRYFSLTPTGCSWVLEMDEFKLMVESNGKKKRFGLENNQSPNPGIVVEISNEFCCQKHCQEILVFDSFVLS